MPTRTLQISLRTLPIGDTVLGPINANNNTIFAGITCDRTVAGGLNSLTEDSTLAVLIQSSGDNGATWKDEAGATWVGGIYTGRNGQLNTDYVNVSGIDDAANRVQMIATVAGPSPIAIAGTITVRT